MSRATKLRKKKQWSDQPDEVVGCEVICESIRIPHLHIYVEIRQDEETGVSYLTHGNLFGSSTFRVPDLATCFDMVAEITRYDENDEPMTRPEGVELIGGTENDDE